MLLGVGALLVVVLLFSASGLIWAWRGKQIDDHPLCRECGFDLTGRAQGSERCSECGAELQKPGAVVVGHRERRWQWVVVLAVLLLLVATSGVTLTVVVARRVDLTPWKPTSWLVSDLSSGNAASQQNAMAELLRRIHAPGAQGSDFLWAADKFLAVQANPKAVWDPRMGDVIEALQAAGLLDSERYVRYLQQVPQHKVLCRNTVQRGEQLAYRIEQDSRSGSRTQLMAREQIELFINGVKVSDKPGGYSGSTLSGGKGSTSGLLWTRSDPFKHLPDGEQRVMLRLTLQIFESWRQADEPNSKPRAQKVIDFEKTIRLVSPGQDQPEAIRTEGLQAALYAAIGSFEVRKESKKQLAIRLKVTNAPAPCAYDVLLVLPEREMLVTTLTFPKGCSTNYYLGAEMPESLPDVVELRFRPNPKLVRATVDLTSYADVELRYPGIATTKPSK